MGSERRYLTLLPTPCHVLPLPQNSVFLLNLCALYTLKHSSHTEQTHDSAWTNTALALLFRFVSSVEVGTGPHQGTRRGIRQPRACGATFIPVSEGQGPLPSGGCGLSSGHISETCEVVPVLARHLREPRPTGRRLGLQGERRGRPTSVSPRNRGN